MFALLRADTQVRPYVSRGSLEWTNLLPSGLELFDTGGNLLARFEARYMK